jgi:hypothetical protein
VKAVSKEVRYRSLAGIIYPAKLVRMVGTRAMIEVDAGAKEPVPVTCTWAEADNGDKFTAWPAAGAQG